MDTKNLIPQDPSPPCAVGTSSRSSSSSISGVNPSLKKPLQNEQQQPQGSQGAQAGGGVGVTGRVGAGEVPGAAAAAVVEGFVTLKAHPFFGGQAFVGESEVMMEGRSACNGMGVVVTSKNSRATAAVQSNDAVRNSKYHLVQSGLWPRFRDVAFHQVRRDLPPASPFFESAFPTVYNAVLRTHPSPHPTVVQSDAAVQKLHTSNTSAPSNRGVAV